MFIYTRFLVTSRQGENMGAQKYSEKMSNGSGIPIRLADAITEDGLHKLQIFRTGEYHHQWYGDFNITKKSLSTMVRNFKQNVLKIDLMLDYNHKVEEAAAWFHKLYIEKSEEEGQWELWAEVDFNDDGKAAIDSKKWRYISGDFHFNHVDNQTGEEYGPTIYGAALTNRPFIKGMTAVVNLNEENTLNGGNIMTIDELKEQNKVLNDTIKTLETSKDESLKKLNDSIATKDAEIKTLGEKVTELEKNEVTIKKENEFTKLLSEKKAVPAQKESFLAGDMIKFAELAGETQETPEGNGGDKSKDTKTLSDDDKEKKFDELLAKTLSENEGMSDAIAIGLVLKANPELAE